jgi:hypothetical protein
VIADVKPGDTIEQQEIFGPVLAVIKANDFDDALKIANDTEFGLTGALYSQDEAKLERAPPRVSRWQLVSQSQMHRCSCRGAPVWWIQYVRNGFQSGRPRLFAALHASEIDCDKDGRYEERASGEECGNLV